MKSIQFYRSKFAKCPAKLDAARPVKAALSPAKAARAWVWVRAARSVIVEEKSKM